MKRKLALLLAAVMVIAAMPMNVFAASKNEIVHGSNAQNKTLFFERDLIKEYSNNELQSGSGGDIDNHGNLEFWSDGAYLEIELGADVKADETFKVKLENASWFFRNRGTQEDVNGLPTVKKGGFYHETVDADDSPMEIELKDAALPTNIGMSTSAASYIITNNAKFTNYDPNAAFEILHDGSGASDLEIAEILNLLRDELTGLSFTYSNFPDITFADLGTYTAPADINADPETANPNVVMSDTAATNAKAHYGVIDTTVADLSDATIDALIQGIKDNDLIIKVDLSVFSKPKFSIVRDANTTDVEIEFHFRISTEVATDIIDGDPIDVTGDFNNGTRPSNWAGSANPNAKLIGLGPAGATMTIGPDANQASSTFIKSKNTYMDYNDDQRYYVYTSIEGILHDPDAINPTPFAAMDKPYTLTVMTSGDETEAVIALPIGAVKGDTIRIPLVIRTTADGDYRVKIESTLTGVTKGNLLLGSKIEGKTNSTIPSKTIRRDDITIDKFRIEELKAGSLDTSRDGFAFSLTAPRGYYFENPKSVGFYTEGDLYWNTTVASEQTGLLPASLAGNVTIQYKENRNTTDESVLWVFIEKDTFMKSRNSKGSLYLNGLKIVAEDSDDIPFGSDLYIAIRSMTGTYYDSLGVAVKYPNDIITDQDVKIGTAQDYDIGLERVKDAIPELVSGRLEGAVYVSGSYYGDDIEDDYHKAAKVKFYEKVADAWWAQRNTVFTLPEQVRFMKVEFDKNTVSAGTSKLTTDAATRLMAGTNVGTSDEGNGVYYNNRKRTGVVTINDNSMTLTNLAIQSSEKASFQFDMWLSIQVDYEGEIDLVLNNRALKYAETDEDITCTIAKAIRPIEIETTVTEVKVGYQYVTVADFDITENVAGALLTGEDVYVSVTDQISVDMSIATGFKAAVTDGNIKIKNITTGSVLGTVDIGRDANLKFTIDRESTTAATISFTDVQVKINRYVPYSNVSVDGNRGIDLVVWGPAVAKNYYYLDENTGTTNVINKNDLFTVAGIAAKYINVATLATDSNQSLFSNHVTVTMGSTSYTVNGQAAELEVAPYVSTASNSAMVPLRFVAVALGLAPEAVKWDAATSTATIDANTRVVQFQTGSSYYTVNGTMVPMVSPDGLPVEMEIMNERAFVPFRALGEAFGIAVDWDGATSTAIYNAPAVQ